jgi:UDP-N-acetylglucosamine--N-acetylmuramyl-(pentapeptide) pyrophosphoryl-undecaprenol N-acetylglucosamine transferase
MMASAKQTLGTVLIMAGGTGGHIFPALSIARLLQSKGYRTEWLGTPRGLEVDVLRDTDIHLHLIDAQGLRGKGLLSVLVAPFMIVSSIWQSLRVIRSVRPCCVLGMGGYVTGPGGVAAKLSGRKLLIHEQNAIAGLTNRLLARIADTVMEAFPATFPAKTGALLTGNPVRVEISALPLKQDSTAQTPLKILIIGGSLGAVAINDLVPQALLSLSAQQRPQIWHQVGKNNVESAALRYREAGITLGENCKVVPFIADMAAAYAWADLVLCRAGATTVSEVAAAGLPSILVPFPYAVDDHQTRNAQWLSEAGAAVMIQQRDLTASELAGLWQQFQQDRSVLIKMAAKARALAHFDANELVATQCMEACKG